VTSNPLEEEFSYSEFRSGAGDSEIPVRINQSGIQTAQELFALASLKEKTTKQENLVGVLNPIIHPLFRSEFIAEFC
jgi:hypothetical protein